MEKIDFVITWVDGNDEAWLEEKSKFRQNDRSDAGVNRYRDLDLLKYWFRGIEKYASWVNKIHFITWGHIPSWLNTDHDKINIVNHADYIPEEYLPTFSSHPIEFNLHRIKGLSRNFVYFNDDMYIIKETKSTDFFRNGLPCDTFALDVVTPADQFAHILVNNLLLVNKNFDKRSMMKKNFPKWINFKYGKYLYRTIALLPWKKFTGFKNPHLPLPMKIEWFENLWEKDYIEVHNTCSHRFRETSDINLWVLRYYNLLEGNFYPQKELGAHIDIFSETDLDIIYKLVKKKSTKVICLNDSIEESSYQRVKEALDNMFYTIFPDRSTFEKI